MKRHGSDLDPELEAFVTPRKIQRETPPALRARVLARARAIVAAGGRPALSRERSPAGTEGAGTARSPSGLDRVRGVARGGRRRGRSGSGALRPTRALAASRRRRTCGPGAEGSDYGRQHSLERTACTRRPDRGRQAAPPVASWREADPFAAELDLLQRAHGAYTRRDFSAALTLIAEHARRFAHGHLAEQREALRVRSLAGSGHADEAHRAAAAFAIQFPRSVLLPRVAGGPESRSRDHQTTGPAGRGRRSPSIVAGAVWVRSPRSAFDRPARIRGGLGLSRRRRLQGRRHRPAGLRPLQRKRARARAGPHRAARCDHRRTHRAARCERQLGRASRRSRR